MGKAKDVRPRNASSGSNVAKGRMVEQIVAAMHDGPGVVVERNVRMPPASGRGEPREIDVLLTSQVAGYPVRLAIECKNERKPIGITYIDAYVGKLQDVGIPVTYGIFVSASGYTRNAVGAARRYGLRLLTLNDVTRQLPATVGKALQTVLYLLLAVNEFTLTNDVQRETTNGELFLFQDADGQPCGTWLDVIWQAWLTGAIPETLGHHEISFEVPPGWYQTVDGRSVVTFSATAKVGVRGLILKLPGTVTGHHLSDALDGSLVRSHVHASFQPPSGALSLEVVETEDELRALDHGNGIRIAVGHIRLPRFDYNGVLWPLSEQAASTMVARLRAFEAGEAPDPRPFTTPDLEGTDLSVFFRSLVVAPGVLKR